MRAHIIRGLSILVLVLAIVWFIVEGGFEPVITALVGLVGLFSAEYVKGGAVNGATPATAIRGASPEARPEHGKKRSVVVLPFDNMSPDPGDEYFAEGLTEEIITDLSYLPSLRVISRNSALVLKQSKKSTLEIARELGVQFVLEGSIRKAANDVRITAQLIDAEADEHLWAERYSGTLDDVFEIQESVSTAIVGALRLQLAAEPERSSTRNSAAHDLYLRGLYSTNSMTEEGLRTAVSLFSKAIEEDPNYALAYAGMARAYVLLADVFMAPVEAYPKARNAAAHALELDPGIAEARAWLATALLVVDHDFEQADQEMIRAVESNPNSADTLILYAWFLITCGRTEEALIQINRAFELDPYSSFSCWMLEGCYLAARDWDQVIEAHRKKLELHPDFFYWDSFGGIAFREIGQYEEALAEYRRLEGVIGAYPFYGLALTHLRMGNEDQAMTILDELLKLTKDTYVPPDQLAMIYVALGDSDSTFEWLERAYEKRSVGLMWLEAFPEYDPVRSDPRFVEFLDRLNYSQRMKVPS